MYMHYLFKNRQCRGKWIYQQREKEISNLSQLLWLTGKYSHVDFLFEVLAVEPTLLGRYFTIWVMVSALFTLIIFEIGSHFTLGPTFTVIFLFMCPWITGMTGLSHHTWPNNTIYRRTFFDYWCVIWHICRIFESEIWVILKSEI
jgi:hypothetical protein